MLIIGNGKLVTRDTQKPFENGAVVIDGTKIATRWSQRRHKRPTRKRNL